MPRTPFLKRATSYEQLWSQIDWQSFTIPKRFNLGVACVDDNAQSTRALTIVAEDRSSVDYTFGDITDRANRLANVLIGVGIGREDIVAIINPQSLETAVSFMAIYRMGAIALPLSHLFGPDGLKYRFENSGAKAVIVTARNVERVREAIGEREVAIIVIGEGAHEGELDFSAALQGASTQFSPADTDAEGPAMLIYTSGTTGNPKGALHAHRLVFGQIPIFEACYDFYPKPNDVLWSIADWAWIAGIMDILVPAWFYGLPVIVDQHEAFDPERAVWLMREHKVSLSLLPATALRGIRSKGIAGGDFSFRAVASGGEALGADMHAWASEFFGCDINDAYGQTEMNGLCCHSSKVFPTKPGAAGRPGPGNIVAILDDNGESVRGQMGEIVIDRRHPLVMKEYWKNPKATEEKFNGNWLLTGDLGHIDEDGYLWFDSRKDDVINSSGYRIGPTEIEDCLGSQESVAMSAVIGVADERRGQVPRAYVVVREGVQADEALIDALRAHVRSRLAKHEVPRDIIFIDELPRTTTGKIIRRELSKD